MSSPGAPVGVPVGLVAPDAPDEVERLGHAVAEGVHLALAGLALARVVGLDDRVVGDAHDGQAVGRGPEVGVAGLAHVPARLGV